MFGTLTERCPALSGSRWLLSVVHAIYAPASHRESLPPDSQPSAASTRLFAACCPPSRHLAYTSRRTATLCPAHSATWGADTPPLKINPFRHCGVGNIRASSRSFILQVVGSIRRMTADAHTTDTTSQSASLTSRSLIACIASIRHDPFASSAVGAAYERWQIRTEVAAAK
jgi:hypothetical protein